MFDLTTRVPRGLVLLVKSCTNKHKAGKDCRQEEKGTTEDEMVGWHHCQKLLSRWPWILFVTKLATADAGKDD